MKRFLFAIIALMAVVNVKGATVTGAFYSKEFTINYQSVDANNQTITLSEKIYMPCKTDWFVLNYSFEDIELVVLNCHPTISHNDGCPTGDNPQLGAIKYMTSENAMVICPDYIGFGQSSGANHPYMCSTLTARNVLDGFKAAMEWAKTVKSKSGKTPVFKNGWYTINIGYSQGGATALAFQRYLETEATSTDRDLVRLRGSLCGAGPYSQNLIFDIYEGRETIDYPSYLPYAIMGLYETFGKTTLRKLPMERCFNKEFLNKTFTSKATGTKTFLEHLTEKKLSIDDLNTMLISNNITNFYDIISNEYRDPTSEVHRSLVKALGHSNLLDGEWTPKAPIAFYHYQDDEVVPFEETVNAYNMFNEMGANVRMLTQGDYSISNNEAWDLAFSLGGYDRDYNHRNCGVYFYIMFLAGNLRPQNINYSVPNTDSSLPYIHAYDVSGTGMSEAKRADRITTAFTYDLPQGKPVFVQFAADVDGYYFGCDAPRYKVGFNEYGEAVGYTPMKDDKDGVDDFKAGEVYVLTVDEGENNILSMTAGVTMKTVDSPLSWRELNMRKTGQFDHNSYVTNYLPFAYDTSDAFTTYAVTAITSENNEKYACAKALSGIIPAGTGTLIKYPSEVEYVYLSPSIENGTDVGDNLLTGNYYDIDNDENYFLLFGLSNKDRLGFWHWYEKDLPIVKAYTAYINTSKTGEIKGFVFEPYDDETAIEGIQAESAMSVWGVDGTQQPAMQKGLNIVRMSNGTIKKVMVK